VEGQLVEALRYIVLKPSGRTMTLGSTQLLTEKRTRGISRE
jgi:hypothetical protein